LQCLVIQRVFDLYAEILKLSDSEIAKVVDGGKVSITVDGEAVELDGDSILVERKEKEDLKVLNDGTLTVALDTKISDDLRKEGYVRDLIRGIQNLRKESGFEVSDRIILTLGGDAELKAAYEMFKDLISGETLAVKSEWKDDFAGSDIDSEDKKWRASVVKA